MFSELASHLHEEMWKRTIVVLTFANQFIRCESMHHHSGPEVVIRERINHHKAHIFDSLSRHIKREVLEGIPFCIAGVEYQKKLPTTEDWV